MVVPIHKKWEANSARIQVVQQERTVQLLAFFDDFSHGKCMNFVLKSTDTLESFGRSGKFGIKLVDAKFALPKTDDDEASRFVCLDMPEYPIEHDDITITFDTESGKAPLHAVSTAQGTADHCGNAIQRGQVSKLRCRGHLGSRRGWDRFGDDFTCVTSIVYPLRSMRLFYGRRFKKQEVLDIT